MKVLIRLLNKMKDQMKILKGNSISKILCSLINPQKDQMIFKIIYRTLKVS